MTTVQNFLSDVLQWRQPVESLSLFLTVFLFLKSTQYIIVQHLRPFALSSKNLWDDILLDIINHTHYSFLITISLWLTSKSYVIPCFKEETIQLMTVLLGIIQVGRWATKITDYALLVSIDKGDPKADISFNTGRNLIKKLALGVIWTIVVILCLDNLGIHVQALMTGLGVTGVAVGFASQNIVSDLFASICILLDKPFLIGDFLSIEGLASGSVEHIGIRTTRLRALGGEEIIISNNSLIKSRLHNYRTLKQRRCLFNLTIKLGATTEQIQLLQIFIKEYLSNQATIRFDRCSLLDLENGLLKFEIVYFVLSDDYIVYVQAHHEFLLSTLKKLEDLHLQLAHPTRTIEKTSPVQLTSRNPQPLNS